MSDKEKIRRILKEKLDLNKNAKGKTNHVMDREDFDWEVEGAEAAEKIEAMTEEQARQWLLTEGGYTEEQLADSLARTDGFIFDLIHKDDPNKGNA